MTKLSVSGLAALVLASGVFGCGCGGAAEAAEALLNTAIAVGVSAARRADGDCYAPCDHGTVCNHETGYCEPSPCERGCDLGTVCNYETGRCEAPPCRHSCGEGERCDVSLPLPRCVPDVGFAPEDPADSDELAVHAAELDGGASVRADEE